ncbi:MAG: gliding motility-associated C-terminal domain-containing protein [Bacteroidia bacterium]
MLRQFPFLIFFLTFYFSIAGQNLVTNPSFEVFDKCPVHRDNFHGEYLTNWYGIGQYYHTCGDKFSTPINIDGYQEPADGSAYIGISTYDDYDSSMGQPTNRSFSATRLSRPLVVGRHYRLSMKVSAIDNRGSGHPPDVQVFYSNGLGMRLFTQWDENRISLKPDNISHVYSKAIITDTTNWTEISGVIKADSAYAYLAIANFFDNANTQIIRPASSNHIFIAWYYIDDVEVREIPEMKVSDTLICEGTEVEISTSYSGSFYWHYAGHPADTLSTANNFTITPTETVTLVFHSMEDDFTDSVDVVVFPPPAIALPDDTLLCEEPVLVLNAFNPGAVYTWSTGDTTAAISVDASGLYRVRAMVGPCMAEDSVYVEVCNPAAFIPTAFSPDGNGLNDVFLPVTSRMSRYRFQIYNRWGQLIFDGAETTSGWNGNNAPEGTYLWIFQGQTLGGDIIRDSGTVQLVR